jgi:hypothetical protein
MAKFVLEKGLVPLSILTTRKLTFRSATSRLTASRFSEESLLSSLLGLRLFRVLE